MTADPNNRIGVQYLDSIDGERDEGDRFVLIMIEPRQWGREPEMLEQLEEKVRSYLAFVRDGFLYRLRPQAEQREIGFELHCAKKPGWKQQGKLNELRGLCENYHISFDVVVKRKGLW